MAAFLGRRLQGRRGDSTEEADGGSGLRAGDSPQGKGLGASPTNTILYNFSETVKKEEDPLGKVNSGGTSQTHTSLKPLLRSPLTIFHLV